jgi:hypothetical protein
VSEALERLQHAAGRRRVIEVEDVLAVAKKGERCDAASLRALAASGNWKRVTESSPGEVPLRSWTDAVALYLEAGVGAVEQWVHQRSDEFAFVVGVLEAVASPESTAAVLRLCASAEADAAEFAATLGTLNLLLTFNLKSVPDQLAQDSRVFLHNVVRRHQANEVLAQAYCALRRVGDSETVALLEHQPDLSPPWESIRRAALRRIRRELRRKARPTGL